MQERQEPIFIHSLFRSGSTWIFDRFRHAGSGYWCYQEPFNETLSKLKDSPESVLEIHEDTSSVLRHPKLEQPYFYEFHAIREHIGNSFQKCISYDCFFDTTICPAFDEYTTTLIHYAKGRPVLQCCRSFGRVAHLKQQFGGVHIHLWRNPWDQWWSYQINGYFDTANLAIINAINPPQIITLLRAELGLEEVRDIRFDQEYQYFQRVSLDAKSRYLIFYVLWLYSLIENRPLSDCDINIDRLSADPDYLQSISEELKYLGIQGLDLSNCHIPMAVYTEEDRAFFEPIEQRAHKLFARVYDLDTLYQALHWQREYRPKGQIDERALIRDGARARAVALRYAEITATALGNSHQAQAQAAQDNDRARMIDQQHQAVINSRSWKLTKPLRLASKFAQWFARGSIAWLTLKPGSRPRRVIGKTLEWFRKKRISVVNRSIDHIKKSPRLKRIALRVLNRFPALGIKLRRIYISPQFAGSSLLVTTTPICFTQKEADTNLKCSPHLSFHQPVGINAAQRTPLESHFKTYEVHK